MGTEGGWDVNPWRVSVTEKSSKAAKSKGKSRSSGVKRPETSFGVVYPVFG